MRKLIIVTLILISSNAYAYGTNGCDNAAIFLTHMEGLNNGTTFTESNCVGNDIKVLTAGGNAKTDTSTYVFGSSSANFDGTNSKITTPDDNVYHFGTGDFSIDFRVRFSAINSVNRIMELGTYSSGGIGVFYGTDSGNYVGIIISGTAYTSNAIFPFTASTNTWYHFAIDRQSNKLRVFVDGVSTGPAQTDNNSVGPTAAGLVLGVWTNQANSWLNGNLDEFRISNVSRFSSDFTRPTSPYCSGCEMTGVIE